MVVIESIQRDGCRADHTEVKVPTHDKLKAFLETKPKDDPWSPYSMKNVTAVMFAKEYK